MNTLAEAQGYVNYFRRQVIALDPDMTYARPTSILRRPLDEGKEGENPNVEVEEITQMPADLNIAIKAHHKAMEMLHGLSKTIAQLGLEGRMVKMQEERDRFIGNAIVAWCAELGIKLNKEKLRKLDKHLGVEDDTG